MTTQADIDEIRRLEAYRPPCLHCDDTTNHGFRWRTDCGAKPYVKDGKLYLPWDHPTNAWNVSNVVSDR